MKIVLHKFTVPLKKPFTISRGTVDEQDTLVVELQHDGQSGFGEATDNSFYGHSIQSMIDSIESVQAKVEATNPTSGEAVWEAIHSDLKSDPFAVSALDIAGQDLYGKLVGKPCYEVWGLEWQDVSPTCLTIGINPVEKMVQELKENPGWSVYKVKLGTPNDLEIIQGLRSVSDATLRVDANCAWSAEETIEKSQWLKDLGVEFIEQPQLRDAPRADHEKAFAESALPIVADESCQVEEDVALCHNAFHGVNVKLCKCGGLTPAVRMLRQARSLGMRTMVGCMVESSVGIAAGAQLLPLLDYADLDGAILMGSDYADGPVLDHGVVSLPNRNGTGVTLNADAEKFRVG